MPTYTTVDIHNGKILHIYYDDNGKKIYKLEDFSPTYYLDDESSNIFDLFGRPVKEYTTENVWEYFKFVRENKYSVNIYGDISPIYQFISKKYKNVNNFNLEYIKTAFIDIEVHCDEGFPDPDIAAWPITAITIKDNKTNRFYVAALSPWEAVKSILKNEISLKDVNFKFFESDDKILEWLVKVLKHIKPDILTGWNADNFDFPYIINRFDYLFNDETLKKELSPIGKVSTEKVNDRDFRNIIGGINLLDYMKLFKKFILKPQESYRLDHITTVMLGKQKVEYHDKYDSLFQMWLDDPQLYIDYNIYDVELMDLLDKKLKLTSIAAAIAFKAKAKFEDSLGTVKVWDTLIYNYLKEKNIVIPPNDQNEKDDYTGGFVFDPVPSLYDWVISFDLNSLYPHVHMEWNISPETIIKDKKVPVRTDILDPKLLNGEIEFDHDYILAGNGCYFDKNKTGCVPIMLNEIYNERKAAKKQMLNYKDKLEAIKAEMARRELK